jgi:branched-chain amino acid transport system permease protein
VNFSVYEFTQSLVSGILVGGAFALLGVGFSLTWGVTRVINVAHAAFAVLAAYLAYWSTKSYGIDPILSLLYIVPLFFILGILFHELFIKPTARRTRDLGLASMVLTFGLGAALENGMAWVWTPDPRVLNTSYLGKALLVGPIAFSYGPMIAFALAAVTLAALYAFLHRTYTGKAVRAVWQDREGAALAGVNLGRVTSLTYGAAMVTAGVAGVAMALMYTFDPATNFAWMIYVFLVVIFGGVGSVLGAALAGLLIGLILGISGVFIPLTWVNMVLFVFLIVLLWVRPSGLMRR